MRNSDKKKEEWFENPITRAPNKFFNPSSPLKRDIWYVWPLIRNSKGNSNFYHITELHPLQASLSRLSKQKSLKLICQTNSIAFKGIENQHFILLYLTEFYQPTSTFPLHNRPMQCFFCPNTAVSGSDLINIHKTSIRSEKDTKNSLDSFYNHTKCHSHLNKRKFIAASTNTNLISTFDCSSMKMVKILFFTWEKMNWRFIGKLLSKF